MTEQRLTEEEVEAGFKESLKDVATIIERLSPHCKTVPDLFDTVKLALENDTHFQLVLSIVSAKPKK